MHPATINFCARPNFLYSAISRMDWTDSCCAGAMKLHVFTTRTSASPARGVISKPERARIPIITSLSTRFFGHPRLTNPTFGISVESFRQLANAILARRTAWRAMIQRRVLREWPKKLPMVVLRTLKILFPNHAAKSWREEWQNAPRAVASRRRLQRVRGSHEPKGFCTAWMGDRDRGGGRKAAARIRGVARAPARSWATTASDDIAVGTDGHRTRGGFLPSDR